MNVFIDVSCSNSLPSKSSRPKEYFAEYGCDLDGFDGQHYFGSVNMIIICDQLFACRHIYLLQFLQNNLKASNISYLLSIYKYKIEKKNNCIICLGKLKLVFFITISPR